MKAWVALIGLVVLAGSSALPAAAANGQARKTAASKLAQFDRNHPWVQRRSLERCSKGRVQIRCVGIARGATKTCRLRLVILRTTPRRRATIKRIACNTRGTGRIHLRAHLSSAPKRDLQNPFKVTYDYSASATRQVATVGEEPTEPPPGVLALYSDGILECATNVGGGFADGECPVTYKALGDHRVTSIYTSGDESATVTEMQTIEPLPTSTGISATYEPLAVARYLAEGCGTTVCELPEGLWDNADIEIGTLQVVVHPVSPWDTLPQTKCPTGDSEPSLPPGCVSVFPDQNGVQNFRVVVLADLQVPKDQMLSPGDPVVATMLAPEVVTLPDSGAGQFSPAEIKDGDLYFRAASGDKAGYIASNATAPLQFTPQVAATLQFR